MTIQKQNEEGYIILFEAPEIKTPEFRLYYDEKGKVICYTCEKLAGNYIIVDAVTFAQARPDVRVVDGKITTVTANAVVSKLMPCDSGQICAKEDISLVVDKKFKGEITNWKMITYEL
jgi:hypothetical protein